MREMNMPDASIPDSDRDWLERLGPERFEVLRNKGTEPPGTGRLLHNHEEGTYVCAGCGQLLFSSDAKYDSGSGWPSFTRPVAEKAVAEQFDTSQGMLRTEVMCSRCGGHLGHVFPDGPGPEGWRFCVNSLSLDFAADADADPPGESNSVD